LLFDNQKVWIYNNVADSYVDCVVEELIFGNKLIIKFKNLETRDSLTYFKNSTLFVLKEDFPIREKGKNYLFDYFGAKVVDRSGDELGVIKEILDIPGNYVFVIKNQNKEYLVPISDDVIQFFDFENSILTINKIEGLFD